jgi:hypothetical protein
MGSTAIALDHLPKRNDFGGRLAYQHGQRVAARCSPEPTDKGESRFFRDVDQSRSDFPALASPRGFVRFVFSLLSGFHNFTFV